MGTIYVLRSLIDGKCYVGQTTTSLKRRLTSHRSRTDTTVGKVMRRCGPSIMEIFSMTDIPSSLLNWFEKEMTKKLDSLEPKGFNIDVGRSKSFSAETRAKMSMRRSGTGNPMYGRKGINSPLHGRKYSPEHCHNISEGLIGHPAWNNKRKA